jgi:hypothetical protein
MTADEETVTEEKYAFTRAEALAWIRAAEPGTRFNAHVSMRQVVPDGDELPDALRTAISLTRESALELVRVYLSDYTEGLGRRIPCSMYRAQRTGDLYIAYWVG